MNAQQTSVQSPSSQPIKTIDIWLIWSFKTFSLGLAFVVLVFLSNPGRGDDAQPEPKDAKGFVERGNTFNDKKEYDKAIADYTEAIRRDPKMSEAYGRRAHSYQAKGENDKAIADSSTALKIDPKLFIAYYGRANAYLHKKDYDKAIKDFNEAIQLSPQSSRSFYGRGVAYLAKSNYDQAIKEFTASLQNDPKYTAAFRKRSEAYKKLGKDSLALADLEEAQRLEQEAFTTNAFTEEARYELLVLALYPKAVRVAILELFNQPNLLMQLTTGKDLEQTIKGLTPNLADSAKILIQNPNILKLIGERPDTFADAAKAFAEDRRKVIELFYLEDKLLETSAKEWSQRLEGDQVALEQLQIAGAALAMKSGTSPMDVGTQKVVGEFIVYSLPTPVFIEHVMANADVYPALSNVIVSQWLSCTNGAAYDRAFYHWWGHYHSYFSDSFLHPDADRVYRLSELAKYDRKCAHLDPASRYENFKEHAKEFPQLSKHHSVDVNRKPLGLFEKPNHKDAHKPGHDPNKPAHKGAIIKVSHGPHPSHEHQMHHAIAAHTHHVQHYKAAKSGRKK
jgi:tetratricopeptide (TPR) repeat protein